MFVFSGEILFMPTTPLWTFLGPGGRFHLSSTDVAPWRDPTVFQRLLETSEGNIWKRGMLSTEEQTPRESHFSSQSKPQGRVSGMRC